MEIGAFASLPDPNYQVLKIKDSEDKFYTWKRQDNRLEFPSAITAKDSCCQEGGHGLTGMRVVCWSWSTTEARDKSSKILQPFVVII